jgi:hypothetical protein
MPLHHESAKHRPISRFKSFFLLLLVLQSPGAISKAQSIAARESFLSEYPAAALKLQNAYSHVRMHGTYTKLDDQGIVIWTKHFEFLREDKFARAEMTTLASTRTEWPPGSIQAIGGNREKYFELTKLQGEATYSLKSIGAKSNFDEHMQTNCFPAYVAFSIGVVSIDDILNHKNAHLVSAEIANLGSIKVIEVAIQSKGSDSSPIIHRLSFLPGSWALVDAKTTFSLPNGQVRLIGRQTVSYIPGSDPPKVARVDEWIEVPMKQGVKLGQRIYDITQVEFASIPPDQFILATYGVKDPSIPERSNGRLWGIVGVVCLASAIGVALAIAAGRRKYA